MVAQLKGGDRTRKQPGFVPSRRAFWYKCDTALQSLGGGALIAFSAGNSEPCTRKRRKAIRLG